MPKSQTPHPLGRRARILLTSVFGPYAQDDEYGSRRINPMELYQNQVTRIQGGFSLRMFHPSFALRMLQANIDAPCTVLDYPTLEDFTREIRDHEYDIVGISSIVPTMLLEFIVVHSAAFTGQVIVGAAARAAKVRSLVGMGLFYSLFAGGIGAAFHTAWPLVAFWLLMLNRMSGVLLGQAVELVPGAEPNPKVTRPEDLPYIELLLRV